MDREAVVALVERHARAWERRDVAAIVADFAADGVLISPGGRWQGHQELNGVASAFFATATDITVVITNVLVEGDQGAVEWTWSETRNSDGRRITVDDGIVFQVREGLIVRWREFFDTAPWR